MMRTLTVAVGLCLPLIVACQAHAAWDVSEDTDPMDNTWRVAATTSAVDSPRTVLGSRVRASLIVRCWQGRPNELDVFVAWQGIFTLDRSIPIRYRFDDGPVLSVSWSRAKSGDAAFYPGDAESTLDFALQLVKARAFHFELQPSYDDRKYMRFDLSGSTAAIGKVIAKCLDAAPSDSSDPASLVKKWRGEGEAEQRKEAERQRLEAERQQRLAKLEEERVRIREEAAQAAARAALEAHKVKFQSYYNNAHRTISGFWIVPEWLRRRDVEVRVSVVAGRDGRILSTAIEKRSGFADLDESVVRALEKARQAGLPPLPPEYTEDQLEFGLIFNPSKS